MSFWTRTRVTSIGSGSPPAPTTRPDRKIRAFFFGPGKSSISPTAIEVGTAGSSTIEYMIVPASERLVHHHPAVPPDAKSALLRLIVDHAERCCAAIV